MEGVVVLTLLLKMQSHVAALLAVRESYTISFSSFISGFLSDLKDHHFVSVLS